MALGMHPMIWLQNRPTNLNGKCFEDTFFGFFRNQYFWSPTIVHYQFVQYLFQFVCINFQIIAAQIVEYVIDVNGQNVHG